MSAFIMTPFYSWGQGNSDKSSISSKVTELETRGSGNQTRSFWLPPNVLSALHMASYREAKPSLHPPNAAASSLTLPPTKCFQIQEKFSSDQTLSETRTVMSKPSLLTFQRRVGSSTTPGVGGHSEGGRDSMATGAPPVPPRLLSGHLWIGGSVEALDASWGDFDPASDSSS